MKKVAILFSALIIVTMLAGMVFSCTPKEDSSQPSTSGTSEKPKEATLIRLVTPQPPQDLIPINCEEMAARFNERAGGEYEIKVYAGETLVKTPELLDSVMTGAVEMGAIGLGVYSGEDSRFYASEVPFLYNNLKADAAAQEEMPALWNTILEDTFNQSAIAGWSITGTELISKVPIKTLEDWDGVLLGSLSPGISGLTEALGGSAVVVPWTDIYSALEKGVVDASFQATPWMQMGKLTDVANNVTWVNAILTSYVLTINLDMFNDMPANIQDILVEEALTMAPSLSEQNMAMDLQLREEFAALGCDVYILPKAERDRWQVQVQPFLDEQWAELGDFGQQLKAIADKANEKFPVE